MHLSIILIDRIYSHSATATRARAGPVYAEIHDSAEAEVHALEHIFSVYNLGNLFCIVPCIHLHHCTSREPETVNTRTTSAKHMRQSQAERFICSPLSPFGNNGCIVRICRTAFCRCRWSFSIVCTALSTEFLQSTRHTVPCKCVHTIDAATHTRHIMRH